MLPYNPTVWGPLQLQRYSPWSAIPQESPLPSLCQTSFHAVGVVPLPAAQRTVTHALHRTRCRLHYPNIPTKPVLALKTTAEDIPTTTTTTHTQTHTLPVPRQHSPVAPKAMHQQDGWARLATALIPDLVTLPLPVAATAGGCDDPQHNGHTNTF